MALYVSKISIPDFILTVYLVLVNPGLAADMGNFPFKYFHRAAEAECLRLTWPLPVSRLGQFPGVNFKVEGLKLKEWKLLHTAMFEGGLKLESWTQGIYSFSIVNLG